MEYRYNLRFNPPAPMLTMSLTVPLSGEKAEMDALIDSGADMTVVPTHVVERLKLRRVDNVLVSGIQRETKEASVYAVILDVEGILTPAIYRVITWERDYGFLGRDVLNRLILLLHGPEQRFEVRT